MNGMLGNQNYRRLEPCVEYESVCVYAHLHAMGKIICAIIIRAKNHIFVVINIQIHNLISKALTISIK